MECLFVYITAPDAASAAHIAETLVRERLAACANIMAGLRSIYWWQGKVEDASEALCVCKTTAARFSALERRVRELHPYEVPCIVALPIAAASAPFLRWIAEETGPCGLAAT